MLTSNNFVKGMNTDIHPKYQEEGTYRLALNAVLETFEGQSPSITNEMGNSICASIPDGKVVNGHTLTDTHDIVIALYDPNGEHELGIYNPITCTYTTQLIGSC